MKGFELRGPVTDGLALETLYTPCLNPIGFLYRPDVNDRTILGHVVEGNEYGLRDITIRPSDGWALDVGAHIGGVAVALAVDYPKLRIIAVEPIPENAELLRKNAMLNGVADRVFVLCAAFGPGDGRDVTLRYRASGSQHFIAGEALAHGDSLVTVPRLDLDRVLGEHQIGRVAFTKIDCEGCELHALSNPAVERLEWIVGEWHNNADALVALLSATHDVTFREFNFEAVFR